MAPDRYADLNKTKDKEPDKMKWNRFRLVLNRLTSKNLFVWKYYISKMF